MREGVPLNEEQKRFIKCLDSALEKMPVYQGRVIRSLEMNLEGLIQFAKQHQINSLVQYNEYISASTKETYHDNPVVILNIKSKSGRDIRRYNTMEREVLFCRNTTFKVLSVTPKGSFYVLEMEEKKC